MGSSAEKHLDPVPADTVTVEAVTVVGVIAVPLTEPPEIPPWTSPPAMAEDDRNKARRYFKATSPA